MGKLTRVMLAGLFCLMCVELPVEVYAQSSSNDLNSRSSRSSRRSSGSRGETTNDRDRRRESRSRDREANSRRSTRGGRSSSKDNKTEEKKDTKTVEASKKSESKGSSKGSSGGGARPPIEITFEMQADPETNIMYIESMGPQPTLNMTVLENKTFATRVMLYNARSSSFNQFDISLKYDPQLIQPIGVDDSSLTGTLTEPARVLVNRQRGLLSMSGDFMDSRNDSFMTLAKIQWKALEPAASTPIRFLNTDSNPSGVFDRYGQNILHAKTNDPIEISPTTGLLNATVAIEPPNGEIAMVEEGSNPFSAVALATNISMGTAEGGMELYLRPRTNAIAVGEEFLVDVVYRNPRRADLDTVKLDIRFDPSVLQVVDADEGNWITRGINIFDGAYHNELPFDFHRKNEAYNTTGLIKYDMGFSSRTAIPREGIIATIRFEAIDSAPRTVVYFDYNQNTDPLAPAGTTGSSDTAISFLGFNLIGKPGSRLNALHNATISVQQRTSFR